MIEDVWSLNPAALYILDQDPLVQGIMRQLGVPNLFARAVEFDEIHTFVAFDNHPTHWIILHLWKGHQNQTGNGLLFEAMPKEVTARGAMLKKLQTLAKQIGAKEKVAFSQLPRRRGA